ncbi:MAG TPA: hypothetical protein VMI31_18515 [Fimbriimonadaceae bacterium]|nr:hypothetical protein [Fimbriimonadaceae bacterium]
MDEIDEAGLRYSSDSEPGISRTRSGMGFSYRWPDGRLVTDADVKDRIRRLAVPPAYQRVWICADPNGHLQATGFDARGRKQYRYHPRFRETCDCHKFERLARFGNELPRLRERVEHDLGLPGAPKEKVLAAIVRLLDRSLIRVGNEEYAKTNSSFGLTTMLTKHTTVAGGRIVFDFVGKSGIRHNIEVHDPRLVRVVRKIQDLPGQHLFQYLDDGGSPHEVSSSEVNRYLAELTGDECTAKDFRTWWGSLLALIEFSCMERPPTKAAAKRAVTDVMKRVSRRLGNTPSVCRKCYVHPRVVEAFQADELGKCYRYPAGPEQIDEIVALYEADLLNVIGRQAA